MPYLRNSSSVSRFREGRQFFNGETHVFFVDYFLGFVGINGIV